MAICDFERKWWHAKLEVKDRNGGSVKSTHTTVDDAAPYTIFDSQITVRLADSVCTNFGLPPAAWDEDEAPGWFVFRPTLADLGGESNLETITSVEQALDPAKRRRFDYTLLAAYDITDIDCTALGPPDTHCPTFKIITSDETNSIVFKFENSDFIETLGCCNIPVDPPNPPDDGPDGIRECARIWFIVEPQGTGILPRLYSWDFDQDPGQELVDRGEVQDPISTSSAARIYHDISWESRNFLWGLEQDGLRRLLIGSSSQPAFSEFPAEIENATVPIFPIDASTSIGGASMSFSLRTGKMYIAANGRLYELEPSNDANWRVTKENEISSSLDVGLSDLAFDPVTGNCYCIFDDNLSTVNYEDPLPSFGALSYVEDNSAFAQFRGLDFILDIGSGDFAAFYGVTDSGQLYTIDSANANTSILTGSAISNTSVGMASCQVGEDLRIFPFPFYPGQAPFCFWVDVSGSMGDVGDAGLGSKTKLQVVQEALTEFIQDFVEDGDQLFLGKFSTGFDVATATTKQAALDWVSSLTSGDSTNFCNTIFRSLFDGTYGTGTLRTVVVFGDGAFSDCTLPFPTPPSPTATSAIDYFTRGVIEARNIHASQFFSVRSVLVNTCTDACPGNPAWESLNALSQAGGTGQPVIFNR